MVQKSTIMIMGMISIQRRKDIAMELTFMRRSVTQKRVTETLEMCSQKR
jgi:hypothetical protein